MAEYIKYMKKLKAFTMAEAIIMLMIISLIMAATLPVVMTPSGVINEAPFKYVMRGDYGVNRDIYAASSENSSIVIGNDRISLENGDKQNYSDSKTNPRIFVYTDDDHTIQRRLIDFYDKENTVHIGKISFDKEGNTAIGRLALNVLDVDADNEEGINNTAIGSYSMATSTTGSNNTALGYSVLSTNTTGIGNVAIGAEAIKDNTTGSKNVAIGAGALNSNTTGTNNIAIGYLAGDGSDETSHRLYIESNESEDFTGENSFIYGDMTTANRALRFNTKTLTFNTENIRIANIPEEEEEEGGEEEEEEPEPISPANILLEGNLYLKGNGFIRTEDELGATHDHKIMTYDDVLAMIQAFSVTSATGGDPTHTHDISGQNYTYEDGDEGLYSDIRLKDITGDFKSGLDEINKLSIKTFTYKKDENKILQVGVIAQDLQKVFPNSVKKASDGYLKIKRDEIFYAMVNAIKELSSMFDDLKVKVEEIFTRLINFEERISKLETEKIKAEKDFENLVKENNELKTRIENLEKTVQSQKEDYNKLFAEIEQIKQAQNK